MFSLFKSYVNKTLNEEADQDMAFLDLSTKQRFAKLFLKRSPSRVVSVDEHTTYIFEHKFNYYKQVGNGSLSTSIRKTLSPLFENWHESIAKHHSMLQLSKLKKEDPDMFDQLNKVFTKLFDAVKKAITQVETTDFINDISKEVRMASLIDEDENDLRRDTDCIDFQNGRLNLKNLEFADRTDKDWCLKFLDYNFQMKPNKHIKREVQEVIKQICNNNDEDYDFILSWLGYMITSKTNQQKFVNIVGPSASNGKSTLIKMVEKAFSIYFYKADRRLFSQNFTKIHKSFAQMKNARAVYMEELSKGKIDSELIKDLVDGNGINNEVMFGTTEYIDILFKLMFLSNNFMNFETDAGLKRRMINIEFKSRFVSADKVEDVKKEDLTNPNIFPLDFGLLKRFSNPDYLNAIVHIVIKKSKAFFEGGPDGLLAIPQKYEALTNELCEENDKFQNFIDNTFILTGKDTDRISKMYFTDLYNGYTKLTHAASTILTSIKSHNLNYQRLQRADHNGQSVRGAIMGIKLKPVNDFDDSSSTSSFTTNSSTVMTDLPDPDGLDSGIPQTIHQQSNMATLQMIQENKNLRERLDTQTSEIEDLKRQLEELRRPKVPVLVADVTPTPVPTKFSFANKMNNITTKSLKSSTVNKMLNSIEI